MSSQVLRATSGSSHCAKVHAYAPGRPCTQHSRAKPLSVVVHSKKKGGEQKNQGLYFDYEPVDTKAAEEVPIEKERLQDEFAWVRNARRKVQRHMGVDSTPKKKRRSPRGSGKRSPSPTSTSNDKGAQDIPDPQAMLSPVQPPPTPPKPATPPSSSPTILEPPGVPQRGGPARPAHPSAVASEAAQPSPAAANNSSSSSSSRSSGVSSNSIGESEEKGSAPRAQAATDVSEVQEELEQYSDEEDDEGGAHQQDGSQHAASQPQGAAASSSATTTRQPSSPQRPAAVKRTATAAIDDARRERISRLISGSPSPESSASADSAAGEGASRVSTRKQRLLSRMQARTPSPDAATPPSPTPAPPATNPAAEAAPGTAVAGAAAAGAVAAAGAGSNGGSSAAAPAPSPQQQQQQGQQNSPSSSTTDADFELPPLPQLPPMPELPTEGLNEEELQAREVLRSMLSLDPADMARQQASTSLSEAYAREQAAQEDFDAWKRQLLANKAAALQQQAGSSGNSSNGSSSETPQQPAMGSEGNGTGERDADDEDDERLLSELDDTEASASRLLASQGRGLEDFNALMSRLRASEDEGVSDAELSRLDGGPKLTEEQVIAQLKTSDPELHALLTSGPPLDHEEDIDELTRTLDSLARMGLGEQGAEEGQGEGAAYEEEEVSDAELREAARQDPDLAALLRGERVGALDLDRELDRELGAEDAGSEDDAEGLDSSDEDMDGDVGFSDLFEALEEDPDISPEDKAAAMQELQGMFNSAGARGKDSGRISKRELLEAGAAKGTTTTGLKSGGGVGSGSGGQEEGEQVPLLPRPVPPRKQ